MAIDRTPYIEDRLVNLPRRLGVEPESFDIVELFGDETPSPPQDILEGTEFFIDDWIAAFHRNREPRAPVGARCCFVRNLEVSGIGHAYVNGHLLMAPELMPSYWRKAVLEYGLPNIDEERTLPVRRLTGPVIVFTGWGESTYGHFLIEMLPRLLLAHRALGQAFAAASMLVPTSAGPWFLPMIREIFGNGTPKVDWYDPSLERVMIDGAVLPALPSIDSWFHPELAGLLDWVGERVSGPPGRKSLAKKIFLTRALFTNPLSEQRRCRNELKLAEIAAREFGYTVLALETFPWPSQVSILSDAEIIIGEFGSALHGAIFSKPETIVGIIGFLNLTQTTIGAFRRHRNAYLASGPRDGEGNYDVDEIAFRGFLGAIAAHAL